MKKIRLLLVGSIIMIATMCTQKTTNEEVQVFLDEYNQNYQRLLVDYSEAEWELNTRIVEGDTLASSKAQEANRKIAAFTGSKENIEKARHYLNHVENLSELQVKQLNTILYMAASNPEVAGEVVQKRIKAETQQTEKLFGFDFMVDSQSITTNEIDRLLIESTNLEERLKVWEASKEVGKVLKEGLANLRDLRNQSVQALEYDDYFSYQVSDYGMTTDEMLELNRKFISEIWPLYRELHTWARYELAEKYNQDVPDMLPAHWLPNRWGQEWTGIIQVEGINLDEKLKEKSAEWIVKEGEKFYLSLGFPALPATFYEKSSLYPLPEDAGYKKNNHASAWHMDNAQDVRSLMSVEPNTSWWETTLHELGHVYYFMSYTNPDVPIILRGGANRAYHEAIGSLIGLASLQKPFLMQYGLVDEEAETDKIQALLNEALNYIVFIPWSAGVMTEFEHELYAKDLPQDQYNQKWWELKSKYQGIVPPVERGVEYCDAASKTHINDDAAQYYDYAISYVLLFQLHDHIARNILQQDPYATNYYGNKEVGDFLHKIMYPGASVDWREHLKETIGTEISAQPLVDYFNPLMDYLKEANTGREHTLPEL